MEFRSCRAVVVYGFVRWVEVIDESVFEMWYRCPETTFCVKIK